MKLFSLAAATSLLLASTAFAKPPQFHFDKADEASGTLLAKGARQFKREFDKVRHNDQTWNSTTAQLTRADYENALKDESVTTTGESHLGLLAKKQNEWDAAIEEALGGSEAPAHQNFRRLLTTKTQVWDAWREAVAGKERHTPLISISDEGENITFSSAGLLVLNVLSGDDSRFESEKENIFAALKESGFLSTEAEVLDQSDFTLSTQLEGTENLVFGAARLLSGADQKTTFGTSSSLTDHASLAYIAPMDASTVMHSSPAANPDVVADDLSNTAVLEALADQSLSSVTDMSGTSTRFADANWLQRISAKVRPGGELRFAGIKVPEKERRIRFLKAGFILESHAEGMLTFKKTVTGKDLHNHLGIWEDTENTFFSEALYKKLYPTEQLDATHWNTHGRPTEHRLAVYDDFNPAKYALLNSDLQEMTLRDLVDHFVHHGDREERAYKSQEEG